MKGRAKTLDKKRIADFRRTVRSYFRTHGRHELPWRRTHDPYRILVSEVMLQQTQVSRVTEKYAEFLDAFPTMHALADARLTDVLSVWSGLGYNRRARFLHEAAREIVAHHGGYVPREEAALRALPGIGAYTARAVCVFAYNRPAVLIETNIRTVFIHYFFSRNTDDAIPDRDIEPLVAATMPPRDPRTWYWALMDYGVYIKQTHGNAARRSAQYTKQVPFQGSLRQVRGALIREITAGPRTLRELEELEFPRERIRAALDGLTRDRLLVHENRRWHIAPSR